jgi:hypothetical protein
LCLWPSQSTSKAKPQTIFLLSEASRCKFRVASGESVTNNIRRQPICPRENLRRGESQRQSLELAAQNPAFNVPYFPVVRLAGLTLSEAHLEHSE